MKFKKIILLVIAFALTLSLFACKKEDENANKKEELESIINGVIIEKEYKNLVGDFNLPDTAGGSYFITWTIDEKYAANVVIAYDDNGMPYIDVTQTESNVKFELVATIEDGGVRVSRVWDGCWVAKIKQPTVATCADVYSAIKGDYLQITGVVTCVGSNQGFWVEDSTGLAFVYDQGSCGVAVGDTVTVKGEKSKNFSMHQLVDPAVVEKTSGTYDVKANAEESDIVTLDAMLDDFFNTNNEEVVKKFGTIYTIEGKITKNTDSSISYDYLIVDPLTGKFIVLYEKYMASDVKNAVKNNLDKYVSATIVFWDTHSGGYGRFAPVAISAKTAPKYTDEQMVNATALILKDQIPSETALDLDLYTSNDFENLTIAWTSSNESALSSEGKVGSSSNDKETVTLTAVITLGEISKTVTFEVEVSFPAELPISDVLVVCDANNSSAIRFKGKVVALDSSNYPYIADATGIVYVRTLLPEGVVVGDVVKVGGIATIYDNSGKQYTRQIKDAKFTKVEEEVTVQVPVEVTIAQLQKLAATEGVLDASSVAAVKESEVYGKVITITGYVTIRGSYSNAFISEANDTESNAVLYYHLSANQEEIKTFEGKKVTLVCCLYDCQGNDGWRLGSYISIVEVAE